MIYLISTCSNRGHLQLGDLLSVNCLRAGGDLHSAAKRIKRFIF